MVKHTETILLARMSWNHHSHEARRIFLQCNGEKNAADLSKRLWNTLPKRVKEKIIKLYEEN